MVPTDAGAGPNRDARELLILTSEEVAQLLEIPPMLDLLEDAFVALSLGRANVPPRVAAVTPKGLLAAMPGYLPDVGLAVKAISVFPGNQRGERPSHQGVIVMFDEDHGTPVCVMDAEHVTAARTAAASAISVRWLARQDARVLTILGAGVQAASHLDAVSFIRDLQEIRVASRSIGQAAALAARYPNATEVGSVRDAVQGADVLCCCTDADEPVIRFEWLTPGVHVTSVGIGREIDRVTIEQASVFVEWRGAATNPPPAGAHELQGSDPDSVTELGCVIGGYSYGRRSSQEITLYKSTGHAIEDAVAARLVYDRALAEGLGRSIPF